MAKCKGESIATQTDLQVSANTVDIENKCQVPPEQCSVQQMQRRRPGLSKAVPSIHHDVPLKGQTPDQLSTKAQGTLRYMCGTFKDLLPKLPPRI